MISMLCVWDLFNADEELPDLQIVPHVDPEASQGVRECQALQLQLRVVVGGIQHPNQ